MIFGKDRCPLLSQANGWDLRDKRFPFPALSEMKISGV